MTSSGPDEVDVTIYRAPGRGPSATLHLEWLGGFALISETRRVTIPAGESDIRFEGVAGGILPQSAIVSGLPEGVIERNRDAYLLSPESLLDRSLGRRVHLRRTSSATGQVRDQDAVIRSGADGAVVLQTAEGYEALRCTGLPETLVYDRVPPDLSARPTLSVRARSSRPVTATITLAYLSSGFDWRANYVANLSADGTRVDLFAWLTLASSDETSFRNADTQAVAGRVNRERVRDEPRDEGRLELRCWPQGSTSDIALEDQAADLAGRGRGRRMAAPSAMEVAQDGEDSIVITGSRIPAEELGDLKLYRLREPVTVAARSQKQVAFLEQAGVRVDMVYRRRIDPRNEDNEPENAQRLLVTRNRTQEGLGLPLPAGGVQLFAAAGERPILIGEGFVRDRAVGEDVEIAVGEAPGVTSRVETGDSAKGREDHVLTVTNDQDRPIRFEAEFGLDEEIEFRPRGRLARRNGMPLWTVTVPANGTAVLRYRTVEIDT